MIVTLLTVLGAYGQSPQPTDTVWRSEQLQEVSVSSKVGRVKTKGLGNTDFISSSELLRAACCNLGESFTTNPSVDVNYADAATGAQQIKLLGLSGTYVQMLTENIPNYRGAAAPYSLGYIPGPWMQSIQVSKGASSVKNGYESITGQINVEFKKPQATPFADANLYYRRESWRPILERTCTCRTVGARHCWATMRYSTRRTTITTMVLPICPRCGRVR